MNIDLTPVLIKKQNFHKKKDIARFSVSQCWGFTRGYTSVDEYLNGKENDFVSCFRMWQGTWKHEQVQELLQLYDPTYEMEKKIVERYYGWDLVGKADAINKDHILEIKTSDKVFEKAKNYMEYQGLMYCSLFKKDYCLIVQPIKTSNKIYLKELARVERDEKKFNRELLKIDKFYQQLKNK